MQRIYRSDQCRGVTEVMRRKVAYRRGVLWFRGQPLMEYAKPSETSRVPLWANKVFVAVVTADVLTAFLGHWRGYDFVSKLLAVVLLGWLILMPTAATLRWKIQSYRFEWPDLLPSTRCVVGYYAVRYAHIDSSARCAP